MLYNNIWSLAQGGITSEKCDRVICKVKFKNVEDRMYVEIYVAFAENLCSF